MATFKNYDPGRIIVQVGGVLITGYAPGTFVKASRDAGSFKDAAGAGGDVVRIRNRDRRGAIVVTLIQSSPSNDYLSGLVTTDEAALGGTGSVAPMLVKDLNGTTLASSNNAWVLQPADIQFADDLQNREWTIRCAELLMLVGGSLV